MRRKGLGYSPATDATLTLWVDPSDSTKVLAVGGGAIGSGATIGTVNTSGGSIARGFTQWGAVARPIWDASVINGLGAIRSVSALLTTSVCGGFTGGISGLTMMVVKQTITATGSAIAFSELNASNGKADIILASIFADGTYGAGGRRTTAFATFQSIVGDSTPAAGTPHITTFAINWAAATASLYQTGIQRKMDQAFQDTGVTGTGEPRMISIGGQAQETGTAGATLGSSYIGEILVWNQFMTPAQCVLPHDYLRRKWGTA